MTKKKVTAADRALIAGRLIVFYENPSKTDAIVELLADLRHLCDKEETCFADLDRLAYQRYVREVRVAGPSPSTRRKTRSAS